MPGVAGGVASRLAISRQLHLQICAAGLLLHGSSVFRAVLAVIIAPRMLLLLSVDDIVTQPLCWLLQHPPLLTPRSLSPSA